MLPLADDAELFNEVTPGTSSVELPEGRAVPEPDLCCGLSIVVDVVSCLPVALSFWNRGLFAGSIVQELEWIGTGEVT